MGAVVPPAIAIAPQLKAGDLVEVFAGPGLKRWRPGRIAGLLSTQALVVYRLKGGRGTREKLVPFSRIRPRTAIRTTGEGGAS